MSKIDEKSELKPGEICIDASQLRAGVHVRLPGPWLEHQFLFNSFVIEDDNQARQIAAMNLPQIYCDITRCKIPPLPIRPNVAPSDTADDEANGITGSGLGACRTSFVSATGMIFL